MRMKLLKVSPYFYCSVFFNSINCTCILFPWLDIATPLSLTNKTIKKKNNGILGKARRIGLHKPKAKTATTTEGK